ncbi:helix-turn-helix domain-containing protein [uncultured Dysgonomonas sp.]|uniref:Transcription regulator BetR N-terminal domain-containing protein n=1 Tax=uncultured Dysgonomonas sp. TaxID=206096 RepID=A0A212JTQ1_9BACT|nr:helix-turn-helix domain-containing protein [uncultured Dysgonomonas sp.]SBW02813.1 conserved hypothetical protein [uncultured Dysgonomonas sp.]
MKNNTKSAVSHKLLRKIPSGIKPADYITNVLGLSKESVYRRLKGTIPFSFEEMLCLAANLDFSMDELFKGFGDNRSAFNLQNNKLIGNENGFVSTLKDHCDTMESIYKAESNQIIMSTNCILAVFTWAFDNLFKFCYYKWLHQFGNTPLNFYFSDLNITEEITNLKNRAISYSTAPNIVLITDRNFLNNTIKEIKYYQERGLISYDETLVLKSELKTFVESFFRFSPYGISQRKNQYEIYLSSLNVENNTSYISYDNKFLSYYWMHSNSCVYTSDPKLCELQKDWLESLKKYSILISHSNQKMQAELYNEHLAQLEKLSE